VAGGHADGHACGVSERRGTVVHLFRRWPVSLATGFFMIVASIPCFAADDAAGSVSTKTVDQNLHLVLRDVINQGADIFNQGDQAGCYRLFQGALMAARSQLAHHPDVQKLIDEGLTRTEQGSTGKRAWVLRKLLDEVRDKINPNPKKSSEKTKQGESANPPEKKKSEVKPNDAKSETDKTKAGSPSDKKSGEAKPPDKKSDTSKEK
jgi:hypothetical protein